MDYMAVLYLVGRIRATYVQSNSIIVEKMVAQLFSTILEFSTIMDFCVVQGNELSSADRVYYVNCEFLFTA